MLLLQQYGFGNIALSKYEIYHIKWNEVNYLQVCDKKPHNTSAVPCNLWTNKIHSGAGQFNAVLNKINNNAAFECDVFQTAENALTGALHLQIQYDI